MRDSCLQSIVGCRLLVGKVTSLSNAIDLEAAREAGNGCHEGIARDRFKRDGSGTCAICGALLPIRLE